MAGPVVAVLVAGLSLVVVEEAGQDQDPAVAGQVVAVEVGPAAAVVAVEVPPKLLKLLV